MKTIATAIVNDDFLLETTVTVSASLDKLGVTYHVSIEDEHNIRSREFCNVGGEDAFKAANEYSRGILAAAFQDDRDVESYLNIGNDR